MIIKELLSRNSRSSKFVYLFLSVFFIISFFFAFLAWTTPLTIEEKVTENTILKQTNFGFKVDVVPSTLFPEGGLIVPESSIFTAITKNIQVNIASIITSDEAISIEGKQKVTMKLVSIDNWEREFFFSEDTELKLQGETKKQLQKEFVIDPKPLFAFIERVEKETKVGGQYNLVIAFEVNGDILYKDKKIPLNEKQEVLLTFSNQQIKLVGDNNKPSHFDTPLTFKQVTPIEKIEIIPQNFNLWGLTAPLVTVRYSSMISSIIFLLVLAYILKFEMANRPQLSEAAKIDKKYRKRLIIVKEKIRSNQSVDMNSFSSLLSLADEKDQPIFRYERQNVFIEYFIVSEGYTYGYIADTKVKEDKDQKIEVIVSSGSDLNA